MAINDYRQSVVNQALGVISTATASGGIGMSTSDIVSKLQTNLDEAILYILENYPWPQFMTEATIQAEAGSPEYSKWTNSFRLPINCIEVKLAFPPSMLPGNEPDDGTIVPIENDYSDFGVEPGDFKGVPFEVQGNEILYANTDELIIVYTKFDDDLSSSTALFRRCVALHLAHMFAFSANQKGGSVRETKQLLDIELTQAKTVAMRYIKRAILIKSYWAYAFRGIYSPNLQLSGF